MDHQAPDGSKKTFVWDGGTPDGGTVSTNAGAMTPDAGTQTTSARPDGGSAQAAEALHAGRFDDDTVDMRGPGEASLEKQLGSDAPPDSAAIARLLARYPGSAAGS